jgi:hypothetical protein
VELVSLSLEHCRFVFHRFQLLTAVQRHVDILTDRASRRENTEQDMSLREPGNLSRSHPSSPFQRAALRQRDSKQPCVRQLMTRSATHRVMSVISSACLCTTRTYQSSAIQSVMSIRNERAEKGKVREPARRGHASLPAWEHSANEPAPV